MQSSSEVSVDLIIRRAMPEDVGRLVELATTAFRDTHRGLDDPAEIEDYVSGAFTPEKFEAILQDARSVLLTALCDGVHVGYAHIAQSTPPPCVSGPAPIELARLYLSQSVIGKGYGSALMNAVHAVARQAGCGTIWLGVYDRNERARDFYKRWGFVDVGTKEFLFGGRSYADPVMSAAVKNAA